MRRLYFLLFMAVLVLICPYSWVKATTIYGEQLGWGLWFSLPGWQWNEGPAAFGYGRYELWGVTAQNSGQPYIWHSGQQGPSDEAYYGITESGYTTPSIKNDHLYGPYTNSCPGDCSAKKNHTHSMDFTTSWTKSEGLDVTSGLSFNFGANFSISGIGGALGFTVSESTTLSQEWTYGESITHHFDLEIPAPGGSGDQHGYRTRDFWVEYRGALWVWQGKLRGVVYDDADYTILDDFVTPPDDPWVAIFHFERTVSTEVYTENHIPCVPEPATVLLLSFGGLLLRRRK